jgi:hypothetical protein
MTDISKCKNTDCPSHMKCWRYLAPSNPDWQAYATFDPDGKDKCEYFEQVEWHYNKQRPRK